MRVAKKYLGYEILVPVILIVILVSGCVQQETDQQTEETKETAAYIFTLKEISQHNSADDCWLLINGKVYNVTGFINSHPGGEAIIEGCGKDATELFETRPMGSGTPHSQRARSWVEDYYIGDLDQ